MYGHSVKVKGITELPDTFQEKANLRLNNGIEALIIFTKQLMDNKGIKIMEIAYGSEAYLESLNLRNEILRKPLGQSLFDEDLSAEVHDFHVAAYIDGILTGILLLTPREPGSVQMRQVAVAQQTQGQGLGSHMVRFCEELARREGFNLMMLHARETAVNFYLKNGYRIEGGMFEEVTIPHFKMAKEL